MRILDKRADSDRYPAIAIIEYSSIAAGITAGDAMMKKAPLSILNAGTVHSGKYLILIGGDVASVEESYNEGLQIRTELIIDKVILPDIHQQVNDGVFGKKLDDYSEAIGVLETSTVSSNVAAADSAVKGADVQILEIRLADGLGGNAFTLFGGNVENVQAAIGIGGDRINNTEITVHTTVIPRIDEQMAAEIRHGSRFFNKIK